MAISMRTTSGVKPANLMLTPSGQVELLDLGLVRHLHVPAPGGQITLPGQFLGTPIMWLPSNAWTATPSMAAPTSTRWAAPLR
jgi:serine/threonine protein kinase